MNYAEDRLDRRARYSNAISSSANSLVADWQQGLKLLHSSASSSYNGHELLGRTLRDAGKCRHAAFHYGMAWMHNPLSPKAAGDYAQMCDLAGFSEIGVLALLYYRAGGKLLVPSEEESDHEHPFRSFGNDLTLSHSFREREELSFLYDKGSASTCGCGLSGCGQSMCFIPMMSLEPIIDELVSYARQYENGRYKEMPTGYQILGALIHSNNNKEPLPLQQKNHVDDLLKFWCNDNNHTYLALEPVLQLLLVKLLYTTFPALACEAVVLLEFEHPRQLANQYKSHWAYYVLVRAVVLGERIKPHRRQFMEHYHVPVWDVLWNKDHRQQEEVNMNKEEYEEGSTQAIRTTKFVGDSDDNNVWSRLVETLDNLQINKDPARVLLPTTWWWHGSKNNYKPLFVVGDSHVLSLAWQTILVPSPRTAVPIVTTGLKAWHTKHDTNFFTQYLLQTCLDRLPSWCRTIIVSAGEIDCREGIGGQQLEGYKNEQRHEKLRQTVSHYVQALIRISIDRNLQILVLPVAPHAHRSEKNGKSTGRAFRRQTMKIWNQMLKKLLLACSKDRVYLLDYERWLRHNKPQQMSEEYVLNPAFNADYTHMNSAFLPHLEQALKETKCDLSLL